MDKIAELRERMRETAEPISPVAARPPQQATDRPWTMTWFDQVFGVTLALELLTLAACLPTLQTMMVREPAFAAQGVGMEQVVYMLGFGLALNIGLWFLTSRLRVNVVRWLFVLMLASVVLGTPFQMATTVALYPVHVAALKGVLALLYGFMVYLLITGETNAWFKQRRDQDRWRGQ
jgi:hypothetical protein